MTAKWELHLGDCLTVMAAMEPNSIDAIVTDPPYGLFFMGRDWDHGVPGVPFWEAALHVAKPGAHLLAFGGTRTHHRLMVAIEDAGWEIRDCLMWLYGSGFPKSANVSKLIDRAAGAEREVIGEQVYADGHVQRSNAPRFNGSEYANGNVYAEDRIRNITAPATDAAKQWDGWGTNLKPAWESIIVAQKPNPSLTQEQLFAIMSIVNFQLLMEITLCQARLQLSANNAESHLRHLAQKSKEVAQNTALSRVWDYPNEGELSPFVVSAAQHLSDTLVGLEKMNLSIVPESVKQHISERLPASLTLTGAVEDLCGLMAMLLSGLEAHIDLSMISSWNSTLVAALNLMNRFTTTTAIEAITVLRTLNWSLFQSISESTTLPKSVLTNGWPSPVSIAASHLSDARQSMSAILTSIAAASATANIGRLSPNWEPIILARKPLSEPNIAANVLRWNCGALNVDGCRIGTETGLQRPQRNGKGITGGWADYAQEPGMYGTPDGQGRWPANLCMDEDAAALLDEQSGERKSGAIAPHHQRHTDGGNGVTFNYMPGARGPIREASTGGASRYFLRVAAEPLCALCEHPINEGLTPCAKSASNAGTNSSPRTTTTNNGSVAINALVFGRHENEATVELSSAPVNSAAKSTKDLPASESISAPTNAEDSRRLKIAQRAKSAGNLCDLCATSIAAGLVALQKAQSPESSLGQAFMSAHKRQILSRCLAGFVALLGNTDTIPTMDSLKLLFGYVRDAMQSSTQTDVTANGSDQTSRLGYHSKASKRDRDEGLEGMPEQDRTARMVASEWKVDARHPDGGYATAPQAKARNHHPTVKPTDLMRWLVRLVTPPNGTILDPFLGSGSTGKAAMLEGFNFVGIEIDSEYLEIARRRIEFALAEYEREQEQAALQPRLLELTP